MKRFLDWIYKLARWFRQFKKIEVKGVIKWVKNE